jgi:hypothetical protein
LFQSSGLPPSAGITGVHSVSVSLSFFITTTETLYTCGLYV